MLLQAALVLVAFIVLDFIWARYMTAVAAGHRVHAALWSFAITALSGFSVIQYVENHWMLVPACIGCAIGTYFGTHKK